jgi:hypothetical protein
MATTPSPYKFGQVYFQPTSGAGAGAGASVQLNLENEWTISPGLKPNVNTALVPYAEFDKVTNSLDQEGSVLFYFNNPPGGSAGADVTLGHHKIVDVEPTKYGRPNDGTAARVVEYRVFISDRRERFVHPRGGYLVAGEINKRPIAQDSDLGEIDANRQKTRNTDEVIGLCLKAMGIAEEITFEDLQHAQKIYDLQWYGNHAPTELEKILQQLGYVFILKANGKFSIERLGEGEKPQIPFTQAMPVMTLPAIDRRGKAVVFISAPNPILDTIRIDGPDDNTFYYVIEDTDGKWKKIDEAKIFNKKKPEDVMAGDFKDIDEEYRQRVIDQLFRCVALSFDSYGPTPIRRWISERDKTPADIELKANIALYSLQDGMFVNGGGFTRVAIDHLYDNGRVIHTVDRLVKLPSGNAAPDLFATAKRLAFKDMSLRCTREVWDVQSGRWVPKFFMVGFQQKTGAPSSSLDQLDESACLNVLATPDGIAVPRPDLVLLRKDGDDQNKDDLVERARLSAPLFVRGSGQQPQLQQAVGFVQGNLSGATSEIRYSQDQLLTSFMVNSFFLPRGTYLRRQKEDAKAGGISGGNAYPKQAETALDRAAQGAGSAAQPVAPIMPAAPTPSPRIAVEVNLVGNSAGRGKYYGGFVTGPSKANPDDPLREPEGRTKGTSGVEILNLREDAAVIFDAGPDHFLPPGIYQGHFVGGGSGGAIVEIDSDRCGGTSTVNLSYTTATDETAQSSHVENADRKSVTLTMPSRTVYNASGDKAEYQMYRTWTVDCGKITNIGGEFRVKVFDTEPCS